MARNELIPLVLSRNAAVKWETTANGYEMDKGTGVYIDFFDTTQNNQQGRLILVVASDTNRTTGGTTEPVPLAIRTSTNQMYTGSGIGKIEIDVPRAVKVDFGATSTVPLRMGVIGPIETARVLDTDNRILIDWSTRTGGTTATAKTITISAIVIP